VIRPDSNGYDLHGKNRIFIRGLYGLISTSECYTGYKSAGFGRKTGKNLPLKNLLGGGK
jgi:hypothetical protein